VDWIVFPKKHRLGSTLKRDDYIFYGDSPNKKSRRITVSPHCRVIKVRKRNGKRVVFYTYPPEADEMAVSWREFRSMAADKSINVPDRCVNKRIKDTAAAAALLKAWDERE
jgi:hypothetical protein